MTTPPASADSRYGRLHDPSKTLILPRQYQRTLGGTHHSGRRRRIASAAGSHPWTFRQRKSVSTDGNCAAARTMRPMAMQHTKPAIRVGVEGCSARVSREARTARNAMQLCNRNISERAGHLKENLRARGPSMSNVAYEKDHQQCRDVCAICSRTAILGACRCGASPDDSADGHCPTIQQSSSGFWPGTTGSDHHRGGRYRAWTARV